MTVIKKSTIVAAPIDQVWDVFANFEGVYLYSPIVETAYLTTPHGELLNAERVCHFYNGQSVEERVTTVEDHSRIVIDVTSGLPGFMKNPYGEILVKDMGNSHTELTMVFHYNVGLGPIGWLMDRLMLRKQFGKSFQGALDGVVKHLKTGKQIGKGLKILDDQEVEEVEKKKIKLLAAHA